LNASLKILIAIGSIILIRLVINYSKLIQARKLLKEYYKYLENPTFEFSERKSKIIQLSKDAGVSDFGVSKIEPAGYGYTKQYEIKGFSNLTLIDPEIINAIQSKFHEAIGVYKHRVCQTINPVFWIEFIIRLPKHALSVLGIKSDNSFSQLVQLIYWIIGIIMGLETLNIINFFESI